MKTHEILKLIEVNKLINKNKPLLSIKIDERNWLKSIEDLKEEYTVLCQEIQDAIDETNSCKEYIQNSDCNHDIRLQHYGLFSNNSICIFCGKSIIGDNCVNWEYSTNRNKYCVDLIAKYQEDEDYYYVPDGYTNDQVYEMIINILKDKKEDEEVDLIKEFKKLNLPNCKINEEKKIPENYILVIGGSNKQFIDNETYLYKNSLKISIDFITYFSELLNTKIELIDNSEILDKEDLKKYFPKENYNLKFTDYDTIEDLEKILLQQKDIPFKIIIDLSELYKYKINNNGISKELYDLKLNEYFPNSHLIRISNLSKRKLEELSEYLNSIQTTENLYAYQNKKYYYLENNELKSDNLENTCKKVKRLLKTKEA